MRIWFGVFIRTRFVASSFSKLRWYAFGHIDPTLDGAWFYPLGWHLVAGLADWFVWRVWFRVLQRVADAGYMDVNEGDLMSLAKIRPWRVRAPFHRARHVRT